MYTTTSSGRFSSDVFTSSCEQKSVCGVRSGRNDVTTRCQEVLRNGLMRITGHEGEWYVPISVLVVDEGLNAFVQRGLRGVLNLHCVSVTCGLGKLLCRHRFHGPSL
jgi:hypothetical protein